MAKRELLAFEAPTATSGGGTIYPATQTGASLAGTAASTGVVAVKGASIAWRAVIVASLLVAGTATISVGIAAAVVLGTDGGIDDGKPVPTEPPVTTEGWGLWAEWSSCSVTCGPGAKTRRRKCYEPVELCVGNDVQADDCYITSCPKKEFGIWSPWGNWSPCTLSCGGGIQERIRECVKDKEDQLDCSGSDRMQRTCNGWGCPSCDRICPDSGRVIKPECLRCVCFGQRYHGIVTTEYNLPLENVRITDAILPPVDLARSDANGRFTIYGACNGIELLFMKGGYQNERRTLRIGQIPQRTRMQKLVDLRISRQPEHRVRLTGESVTFCCEAYGRSNRAHYYEWFYESQLIDPSVYNYNNQLTITDLTQSKHAGFYKCRASNDHSAIFSDDAILQIEDRTETFCTKEPRKYMVTLPDGCEYNKMASLDQGRCGMNRCRFSSQNDSNQCLDDDTYCCGPATYNKVHITCQDYTMVYYLVKECACVPCKKQKIFITGQVYDAESKLPIPLAWIKVNGTKVAISNAAGIFTFRVPYRTKDVPIVVQDILFRYSTTLKTEHIPAFLEGMVYVTIPLWKYGKDTTVSGSSETIVKIGRSGFEPYAQLKVPASSLYTLRGVKYRGMGAIKTAALDVKYYKDFFKSPTDLDFLDPEGNLQKKQLIGLFSLNFYSRFRHTPLQVSKELELSIDISTLDSSAGKNAYIWSLDLLTGHWKQIGTLEVAETLNTSQFSSVAAGKFHYYPWNTWICIAYEIQNICHSKLQVYKTNHFTQEELIKGASFTLVSTRADGTVAEVSNIRTQTDLDDNNGYCIAHICDVTEPKNDYAGYILVEYPQIFPTAESMITTQQLNAACPVKTVDGEHVEGLSDDLVDTLNYQCMVDENGNQGARVNLDLVSVTKNGPFYRSNGYNNDLRGWAYAEDCSYAGYKGVKENRFPFYETNINVMPHELCAVKSIPVEEVNYGQTTNQNYQAWFSKSAEGIYETCFIKVLISNWRKNPIQVLSMMGNLTISEDPVGQKLSYGATHGCATSKEDAVCIEFKHPGVVSSGYGNHKIDETLLRIKAVEKLKADDIPNCSLRRVRKCLQKSYAHKILEQNSTDTFEMYVDKDVSTRGSDIGIYCTSSVTYESKEDSRLAALQSCQRGNDNIVVDECNDKGSDDPEKLGWAVHFTCL